MKKDCNIEKELKKLLGVVFIVLVGVFIGTLINAYLSLNNSHLSEYSADFFKSPTLIVISLSYIMIMFFIGLSALGQPFVLLLMLIYGALIGYISSTVFLLYSFSGFKICALCLTPYLIIHAIGMILLATNSINMSCLISELLTCDGVISNKRQSFKIYFSKTLLFSIIVLISFAVKAIIEYLIY